MSHTSFSFLRDRHVSATLLTAASTCFLFLAVSTPAAATITARLNGVQVMSAPQAARQPPRVLDAPSVHTGLRRRFADSAGERHRRLNQRAINRPAAPAPLPLPRHFDPDLRGRR